MDLPSVLIATSAAVAVLLIAFALARFMSDSELDARIDRFGSRRSGQTEASPQSFDLAQAVTTNKAVASLNRVVEGRAFGANMARDLARADLRIKVSEFLIIWAAVAAAVPLLLLGLSVVIPSLGNPPILLLGFLIGALLPRMWLSRRQRIRISRFNDQLADTISLLANALRAGSSFLQGCELVTRETQPPISTEFSRLIREVNFGLPLDKALENTVRRVRSEDLELLATAIGIQYQVGGNLAEVLDSIAFTIRERVRIKGEIRTLTAQQRLSGYIVALLPIGLATFLFLLIPRFLAPMFASPPSIIGLPAGMVMLFVGGLMMLFGFAIIRRIVDIDL